MEVIHIRNTKASVEKIKAIELKQQIGIAFEAVLVCLFLYLEFYFAALFFTIMLFWFLKTYLEFLKKKSKKQF